MPHRPSPLPHDLAGRAFRTADARAAGVSRGRLQGAGLRRAHRGVWVDAAAPDTLASRCAAALLALPPGTVFSHHTAAALRGLPAPDADDLHVIVPGRRAPRVAGITAHLGAVGDQRETFRGLPLTTRPRLWLDLADELERVELIALGDAILRSGRVRPADLEAVLEAAAGRRGVRNARAALPALELRVDSPQETRLRMLLIDGGLPRPIVNRPVYDAAGGWIAIPDLHYPLERVPIEYEGEHHLTKEQARRDIRRDEQYRDEGWGLVRVVAEDLKRPALLVARVARQLELGRRRHGGAPNPQ